MSTFIRRQPVRTVDLGTRPGLHGQVLISSGLAGVDKLLGGGLPLGSIMLIIEDSISQQHINMLRCFLAEGISCNHSVAWVTADSLTPASTAAFIPSLAKSQSSNSQQQALNPMSSSNHSTVTATTGTCAAASSSAEAPDDGLKIAWQYRKYIQRAEASPHVQQVERGSAQQVERGSAMSSSRGSSSFTRAGGSSSTSSSTSSAAKNVAAGISREWCHQYDLSKGMTPTELQGSRLETYCWQQQQGCAVTAAGTAATAFVRRFQPVGPIAVPSREPSSVGRLVIHSLGGPAWWSTDSSNSSSLASIESAILAAVADLRLQIQDATCAAVITCPAGLFSDSFQARLQHLADAVLCIQCLADNSDVFRLLPDPLSASALLEVRRLPTLGLLRQRFMDERLYLIRHKRRSISVSVLDLLPLEALDSAAEQKKQAAQVPAVAKICGSGPAKGNTLDF